MELPPQCSPGVGWLHRAGARLRTWWLTKMVGTCLGMAAFFVAYFWLLRHPLYPVTTMPLTVVDRWVGFCPESLALYFSLWLYVSLAPALLIDRRELIAYVWAAAGLGVGGLGVFLFWPTAVPRPDVDWAQHPAFAFLESVDATGNACPSLHVAFTVFTAVELGRLLRQLGAGRLARALNWLWCLGILYSTVATRQHVSLDVLAGAVLGAAAAGARLGWLRAAAGPPSRPAPV